jgi:O-antigen ligase
MMKTFLYVLNLLLAFSLPFEIIHPVLVLPWFAFTNLELLVVAIVVTWLVHSVLLGAPIVRTDAVYTTTGFTWRGLVRRPLIWCPVLFLALAVLSAALAPEHRLDALKFVTRSAMGLAIFFMLIHTVRSHAYLGALLWAIVMGAGVSGLIAEAAGGSQQEALLAPLLNLFKEAPTRVGGELRVSASFQYATIAAMFFEMIVPLALALAATGQSRLRRWLALAVALLATANVVLTFTRSGMVTLAGVLAIMLVLAWRQPRFRPLAPATLLALGALAATTAILAWQAGTFRTRLMTENDLSWYGATYAAPASLRLAAGEPITVTVAIQNTGTVAWHTTGENPFALGYYWMKPDERGEQTLQGSHIEVPLPRLVTPGETVHVTMMLHPSLPPDDYQLVWGMLQHNILWFRHRNIPEAHTAVHIEKSTEISTPLETTAQHGAIPSSDLPALPPTVRRLDLWQAALRMWIERPLLGIGPDNFRLLYGRYLNLSNWDSRLHANNLYLELLAGWGLAGTLAFAGLIFVIARRWLNLWQSATAPRGRPLGRPFAIWSLALGASFLAFFVHGFLDYFLEFVALYLLFWMVAGLIVSAEQLSEWRFAPVADGALRPLRDQDS